MAPGVNFCGVGRGIEWRFEQEETERTGRWEGQPRGLTEGSRRSFGAKGERPPGSRVGWPSTLEGCQTRPRQLLPGPLAPAPQRRVWHPGPGCRTFAALLPGGRRGLGAATSGYFLATLWVDCRRRLHLVRPLDVRSSMFDVGCSNRIMAETSPGCCPAAPCPPRRASPDSRRHPPCGPGRRAGPCPGRSAVASLRPGLRSPH
jgi:hypothetical protein